MFLANEIAENEEQDQKGNVESGKQTDIVSFFGGIVADVFPEGDQTCQRGNESSCSADVDAPEQTAVVGRKARKENCRRDVTDDLTRHRTYDQRIFCKQGSDPSLNGLNTGEVSCKNEKAYEGQQKGVIHRGERLAVGKQ